MMVKGLVQLASLAVLAGAGALALSFLGRWHPAGDSLAVFRTPIALGVLVLAGLVLAAGARGPAAVGAIAALLSLGTTLPHYVDWPGQAEASGRELKVYQKNLWFRMADARPVVADILASGADIVTLQEVGRGTRQVLDALKEAYPTQVYCAYSAGVGGVAVLSRFREIRGMRDCREGTGALLVGLKTPDGPLRAGSIHLHWPWPNEQAAQVDGIARRLARSDLPTIIGGDFNMVRWSATLRRIGAASGTAPVGAAKVTLRHRRGPLHLAIDHVLASGGKGRLEPRPLAGSDHNGLLATVRMPERDGG